MILLQDNSMSVASFVFASSIIVAAGIVMFSIRSIFKSFEKAREDKWNDLIKEHKKQWDKEAEFRQAMNNTVSIIDIKVDSLKAGLSAVNHDFNTAFIPAYNEAWKSGLEEFKARNPYAK